MRGALAVRFARLLVRFGGVAVSLFGMLGRCGVIVLIVVLGRSAVRLGRLFMVLGGFGVACLRHGRFLS